MKRTERSIVVTGDVTIDWMQWSVKAQDDLAEGGRSSRNWELYPGTKMAARPGGALLLARFVREASKLPVLSPNLEKIESIPPSEIIHSLVSLGEFAAPANQKDEKKSFYRVVKEGGYDGPPVSQEKFLPVANDNANAEIVVLDDAGDGFRDSVNSWPKALTSKKKPIVILKMSRPLRRGKLWEYVTRHHADRLIVVINADHLREEGIHISRRLSWERTAKECAWQMAYNRTIMPLAECRHLIIRFDLDGAIYLKKSTDHKESFLFYDPARVEGGYREEYPGGMIGLFSTFVAALTASVAENELDGIREGVRNGIISSRRLLRHGFGKDAANLDYPGAVLFDPDQEKDPFIADIAIPDPSSLDSADPDFWTILGELTKTNLEEIAKKILVRGTDPTMERVPVSQFGDLKTVDRNEIENFRSIKNLITEYHAKDCNERPLSIAVFGPPGSGKSFGATQIAKSVGGDTIKKLEFNLSQWKEASDLNKALHQVRDVVLEGKVPLVFFDEFDSTAFGMPLGWLKFFLDPMQNGMFKEGETNHPIGKSIFIFAGGTSESFRKFSRVGAAEDEVTRFKEAKGTDFVSRLRGYMDIIGSNPTDENDHLYVVRRAMLLRSILLKKAGHLFSRDKLLQIKTGVSRAMLNISRYKHGVRSMEAIIDMSMLSNRHVFEQSALPSTRQLDLHVNAEEFSQLMAFAVLY
ncbi:ATP-binding protein, partial [bacterium]